MLARVAAWWWPTFIVLYPLLYWPAEYAFMYQLRLACTAIAITGGALLALLAHPRSTSRAWAHPPVLIAAAYATWTFIAALNAPSPSHALTGNGTYGGDGAAWTALLAGAFALTYLRSTHDPQHTLRVTWAAVLTGFLLGVFALAETDLGVGLIYAVRPPDLPIVNFPQKGHLAGYLLLACAAAIHLRRPGALPALVTAAALGLTLNRTALAALLIIAVLSAVRARTTLPLAALALTGALAGTLYASLHAQQTKQIASGNTLQTRTLLWTAAARATLERPLTGWGGGQYHHHWTGHLTPSELRRLTRMEFNLTLDRADGLFLHGARNGEPVTMRILSWNAHNQVLNEAIRAGLPGAALYLALLFTALRGLRRTEPAAVAVLAYALFGLLWYAHPHVQGAVWALMGAAAAIPAARAHGAVRERLPANRAPT